MTTHYSIGDPEEYKLSYDTTNKMKDFSSQTIEKAALNKNQMDDLRGLLFYYNLYCQLLFFS